MRRYPDIITRALQAASLESRRIILASPEDDITRAQANDNRAGYIGIATTFQAPASVLQVLTENGWQYVVSVFPDDLRTTADHERPILGADRFDRLATLYPQLQFRLI